MINKEVFSELLFIKFEDYFIFNEYAQKYIDLVYSSDTDIDSQILEKHHVVPVCLYKQIYNCVTRRQAEKLADTDDLNFIKTLSWQQHLLAHFYLYKFCINSKFKTKLGLTVKLLLHFANDDKKLKKNLNTLSEAELYQIILGADKVDTTGMFGKAVVCIETNTTYNNISEANAAFDKSRWHYLGIRNACLNIDGQQTALGYHWCFLNDTNKLEHLLKLFYGKSPSLPINSGKQIYCIETMEIFSSAFQAAKKYNIHRGTVLNCCKKHWLTAGSKHFCFLADKDDFKITDKPKRTAEQRLFIGQRTREAISNIDPAIQNNWHKKAAEFWQNKNFHYYNNGVNEIRASTCPEGWVQGRLPKYKTKGKPIRCIELNMIFSSVTEAAHRFNVTRSAITAAVTGKNKTAIGYHWEYYIV